MTTLLAADIGGTKCELAVFALGGDDCRPLASRRYPSRDYGGIDEIIALFLRECGLRPRFASLAVAGVTGKKRAIVTNLPWIIEAERVAAAFGFTRVVLLNDMTAVCASVPLLGPEDRIELQPGDGEGGEMVAVIAPGTGLGEGLLVQSDSVFFPCGGEGGHSDFAPVDEEQQDLLRWMLRRGGPVSCEDLIAGPGIANLYDFLKETGRGQESGAVAEALPAADDRTPVIADAALAGEPCPLCRRTLELFLSILGSEAGNLALKTYARGGLYIGGGVVPRLAGKISFAGLLAAFRRKGRMEELMAAIPVRLITRKDSALLGAASYGRAALAGACKAE
ncbi:glucokinase [Desulfoprunum benzoelyticum]|uniref:Glucokinase n=1 Tax=Desulfoprunum benzoelyticum TaxID=1506996 RepID=A0A840UQB1_9BACT|nr:glucokinase [Desulfoprunum benzoelyticum]MBB5347835.1 glucokinase [Desulfoprunum benzoelyticum]MBM9530696.1 glucokinase [Desulfoprunum benzoelyticum]